MARKGGTSDIPKSHTIRKTMANEIYHILYSGQDKNFKKDMVREIESWLTRNDILFDEEPAALAKEFQETRRD